jgi:peptide deformylase
VLRLPAPQLKLVVLFNPEVLLATEPKVTREGCMSVPDLTGNVLRYPEWLSEARPRRAASR